MQGVPSINSSPLAPQQQEQQQQQPTPKVGKKNEAHRDENQHEIKSKKNELTKTAQNRNMQRNRKVTLIGTSNVKHIRTNIRSTRNIDLEKVTKFTMKDAKAYVESSNFDKSSSAVILHTLCNDLQNQSPEACMEEMDNLINTINGNCPDMKVIISLGIPRKNEVFNRKVEKLNVLIKENLQSKNNVTF